MGKKRYIALGMALGMAITGAINVYAADAADTVTAFLRDNFSISYNGEAKTLPDGYDILVYNNRSYLPLRYVSELLGCQVDWNDTTRQISITPKQDGNSGNNGGTTNPGSTVDYKTLPQIYEIADFSVTAEQYFTDDYGDRLFIKVKNKKEDSGSILRLVSASTTYTVNGTKYGINDVTTGYWDNRWYTQYIEDDSSLEGYLRLPQDIGKYDSFSVHLEVQYDGETTTYPVDFNIKLS